MTFIFDDLAGEEAFSIRGETCKYLMKVRRHRVGDRVAFRRPQEPVQLYTYEIVASDGRTARLELRGSEIREVAHPCSLHLGWCVIDGRSVEKVLPLLNELGVARITFVYARRSQKNFTPDWKRYERILHSSMQQCGRSTMMEFSVAESVEIFVETHPECITFDFCDRVFDGEVSGTQTVLIGPEGGFSDEERALFSKERMFRLDTPMVLRSETAAVAVSSKILL